MRGALITVEGVEGSGKSTQCQRLAARLGARGLVVVATSEPDGTPLGVAIRSLFEGPGPAPTGLASAFLFLAARHQHVTEVIRPALAGGALVLCDRYTDATLAYQGWGQGMDVETLRDLNALATGGILPDLTLLLDLEPATGLARIGARRLDAFERQDLEFHRRVREGYLEIARAEKSRVVVVPAEGDPEAVHALAWRAVEAFLERREVGRGA
jgi:dTMP kinase